MAPRTLLFFGAATVGSFLVLTNCSLEGLSGGIVLDDSGNAMTMDLDAQDEASLDGGGGRDGSADGDRVLGDAMHGAGCDCGPCVVSGGALYCHDTDYGPVYADHTTAVTIAHLPSCCGRFDCWAAGDEHEGGNTTWYRTIGISALDDKTPTQGWVRAYDVATPGTFDTDPPTAHGLAVCP